MSSDTTRIVPRKRAPAAQAVRQGGGTTCAV